LFSSNSEFKKDAILSAWDGGIIKGLLKGLQEAAAAQPDTRGASNGRKYGIAPESLSGAFDTALTAAQEGGMRFSGRSGMK
jgi:hypothetical protein